MRIWFLGEDNVEKGLKIVSPSAVLARAIAGTRYVMMAIVCDIG